LAPFYG